MLRRLHDEKMVEQNKELARGDMPLEDALGIIKQESKLGRNIARALVKIKEGRIQSTAVKVGVMAAILSLEPNKVKRALMHHWSDTIGGKLV